MRKKAGRSYMRTAAIVLFLVGAAAVTYYGAVPLWLAGTVLCLLGVSLYVTNVKLVKHFIVVRAPTSSSDESWKATAGMGVVPRWVSLVGWLAVPALIAAALWFLLVWVVSAFSWSS